ncbi:hypothetical protein SAMN05518849_116119 [Sphingobium sp. AP50]|uniref:alpha/beta hydrolase n=1 Tax=Sphingobium sp. AP50 TaxID=1884369 RepID=UPI0008C6FDF3|nr:alpha/beta hydrolase-fold protein [Sphingobium sp. AP50]SEJ88067.1 hypothetical protein SAMN05518849_116119 [Sphingobium sp. AP50]
MKHFPAAVGLPLALFAGAAAPLFAQPDTSLPAPQTIADRGHPLYRFETLKVASPDGARSYLLKVAIPKRKAPKTGYPAIWMLDGKAAMAAIDEKMLDTLDAAGPPVIVAVGHDSPLRLDTTERTRDYTPGPQSQDTRGRKSGEADAILALMTGDMRSRVAALAPIDPKRQTLWGHSLGGLFTLHVLLVHPQAFSAYYAASPSLWWNDGAITHGATTGLRCRCTLVIGEGSTTEVDPARAARAGRRAIGAEGRQAFDDRLKAIKGLKVQRQDFPGLTHGPMFNATIPPALRLSVGLRP